MWILSEEEMRERFPTIEKLEQDCGTNGQNSWGLISNHKEYRFGTASEDWILLITLTKIKEKSESEWRRSGTANVVFFYHVDPKTKLLLRFGTHEFPPRKHRLSLPSRPSPLLH